MEQESSAALRILRSARNIKNVRRHRTLYIQRRSDNRPLILHPLTPFFALHLPLLTHTPPITLAQTQTCTNVPGHTDEFSRLLPLFPWSRYSTDKTSSSTPFCHLYTIFLAIANIHLRGAPSISRYLLSHPTASPAPFAIDLRRLFARSRRAR